MIRRPVQQSPSWFGFPTPFHPLAGTGRLSWGKQTASECRDKFSDQEHRRGQGTERETRRPAITYVLYLTADVCLLSCRAIRRQQSGGAYNCCSLPRPENYPCARRHTHAWTVEENEDDAAFSPHRMHLCDSDHCDSLSRHSIRCRACHCHVSPPPGRRSDTVITRAGAEASDAYCLLPGRKRGAGSRVARARFTSV